MGAVAGAVGGLALVAAITIGVLLYRRLSSALPPPIATPPQPQPSPPAAVKMVDEGVMAAGGGIEGEL